MDVTKRRFLRTAAFLACAAPLLAACDAGAGGSSLSLRGIEATNKRVEALERRVTELEARATGGVKGAMTEPAEAAHRNP